MNWWAVGPSETKPTVLKEQTMTVEQRIGAMEREAERLRLMGGVAAVAPRWAARVRP
jgi:hypothetical protein